MAWILVLVVVTGALWFLFVTLFTPRIDYRVSAPLRPDSREFLHVIQATCQAAMHGHNAVEILTNGTQFYPAMRDAIAQAEASVNLEAYIFEPGDATNMLIDAMVDRARAGVEVRIVLDAIGSANMTGEPARRLEKAGCQLHFYQPATWYRLHRLNNRTHRELLIVDGKLAFTGGAGVADWWFRPIDGVPAWRDTMVRIEGPIVTALQGVFAHYALAEEAWDCAPENVKTCRFERALITDRFKLIARPGRDPLLLFDLREPGVLDRAIAAGEEILRACVEAGGTISGEHGIGLEKRDYMRWIFSDDDIAAMLQVRCAFDPSGVMNPCKQLPTGASCADIKTAKGAMRAVAAGAWI